MKKITLEEKTEVELTEREIKIYNQGWAEGARYVKDAVLIIIVVLVVIFAIISLIK